MKLLLSPSKTKTLVGVPTKESFDIGQSLAIVHYMASLPVEAVQKALKLKKDKAEEVLFFYKNYEKEPVGEAVASYTGIAFKNFDYAHLSERGKAFAKKHLIILSALYGIVTVGAPMKNYRLDLENSVYPKGAPTLRSIWKDKVSEYLISEDWILNLASKEYATLVEHPNCVTVVFEEERNGVWKQLSTSSKRMRGKMARYVVEHELQQIEDLPMQIESFCKEICEERVIRYRKYDS